MADWAALPTELLDSVRLRADPPTWRALDQAAGAARRDPAAGAASAVQRLHGLLQLLRNRVWVSNGNRAAAGLTLVLHDETVTLQALHGDGCWLLQGSRRRDLCIGMVQPDACVLTHLRPLIRRGLEAGRPATVDLWVSVPHVPLARYQGPQLGVHPGYAHLQDQQPGGLRPRLALLLAALYGAPAGALRVNCISPSYKRVLTSRLAAALFTNSDLAAPMEGGVTETLEYILQHHSDIVQINLVRPGVTVAAFWPPEFNLLGQNRQLL